jgi:murein DD-endopeptidase MepM/ murein hydrolase activator NlpD
MTQAIGRNKFGKCLIVLSALAVSGCGWAEWPPAKNKSSYKGSSQSNQQTRQQTGQHQSSHSQRAATTLRYQVKRRPVSATRRVTPVRAPLRGGGEVKVARNDTVYAISRRYGVSMRAIIEANQLRPPFALRVGQRLNIPAVREHRVRAGETLNAIAHTYGLSVYELARRNRLQSPYRVNSGQTLIIAQSITPPVTPRRMTGTASSALGPAVKPVSLPKIDAWRQATPQRVKAIPVSTSKQKAVKHATRTGTRTVKPKRKVRTVRAGPKRIYRNTRGFIWPLQGRLISGFGPKAKGLHNDGINIAAPRGAPVRAAKSGVVAYAGNELRGFGNLLLIKHSNGWVTAYAHTDKILVKRGDRVGKGQIIARVGKTGTVSRPQLHFEMRRGKRPVNPKRFLRPA